jgi:hypothetical protein
VIDLCSDVYDAACRSNALPMVEIAFSVLDGILVDIQVLGQFRFLKG